MDNLIVMFSPVLLIVIAILVKSHYFVTPKEMDDKISFEVCELRKEFENKFSTKEIADIIREDIKRLEDKIDTLIEYNLTKH